VDTAGEIAACQITSPSAAERRGRSLPCRREPSTARSVLWPSPRPSPRPRRTWRPRVRRGCPGSTTSSTWACPWIPL